MKTGEKRGISLKINYLEESFKARSLFLDEFAFSPAYIPKKLLHRENELIILSRIFLSVLKKPYDYSKKIMIVGNVGVGKTVTIHVFGKMLKESALKRDFNLEYVHINCRTKKSSYLVLQTILNALIDSIPSRGLSPGELINILSKRLEKKSCHLVLILDELDFLLKIDSDLVYSLSRLNENNLDQNIPLSIIGVVKNTANLCNLDEATLSTLQNEILKFKKYSSDQIFDILKDRANVGLAPGVASDEILKMISDIVSKTGDVRTAIRLLKNAAVYCENHDLINITPESVRCVNLEFSPLTYDDLIHFGIHELFLLKAICDLLIAQNSQVIPLNEIKEEYFSICGDFESIPRSNTQIWEYIQNLKKYDIISTTVKNKKIRGRRTYIGISEYSVKKIGEEINIIIKNKEDFDKND